jgi:hypothetical protein
VIDHAPDRQQPTSCLHLGQRRFGNHRDQQPRGLGVCACVSDPASQRLVKRIVRRNEVIPPRRDGKCT